MERQDVVAFTCVDCDNRVIRFAPTKQLIDPDRKQLAVMLLMAIRAHRRAVHQEEQQ